MVAKIDLLSCPERKYNFLLPNKFSFDALSGWNPFSGHRVNLSKEEFTPIQMFYHARSTLYQNIRVRNISLWNVSFLGGAIREECSLFHEIFSHNAFAISCNRICYNAFPEINNHEYFMTASLKQLKNAEGPAFRQTVVTDYLTSYRLQNDLRRPKEIILSVM